MLAHGKVKPLADPFRRPEALVFVGKLRGTDPVSPRGQCLKVGTTWGVVRL